MKKHNSKVRKRLSGKVKELLLRESGSFTIEASVVLPLLAMLLLIFMLLGIYMFQKNVVYYIASTTSERAAFSWNNSYRDPASGILAEPQYDALYWRIGQDNMLTSLFGLNEDAADISLPIPLTRQQQAAAGSGGSSGGGGSTGRESLPERKLSATGERVLGSAEYEGELKYSRSLLIRKITTKLKQPLTIAPKFGNWEMKEPAAMSAASIVDPVEFIRSVDLVRYYTGKFKGDNGSGKANAGKVLESYEGTGQQGQ